MQQRVRIVAMGDSTTAGTPGFLSPAEAPPAGQGDHETHAPSPPSSSPVYAADRSPSAGVLSRRRRANRRAPTERAGFGRSCVSTIPRAAKSGRIDPGGCGMASTSRSVNVS